MPLFYYLTIVSQSGENFKHFLKNKKQCEKLHKNVGITKLAGARFYKRFLKIIKCCF